MIDRKVGQTGDKNYRDRVIRHIAIVLSFVLSFHMILPHMGSIEAYAAEGNIREIKDFEDFFIFASASQSYDYQDVTVKLTNDIKLDQQEIKDMLEEYGVDHLTIGTKDRPFKGTFDGQNHTIEGLVYDPGIIKDPNSGLFSFTDGATIKNLTVKDASIESVYQGGIIVGHAKDTHLENLTVLNSKLKISPANNVVSLITNLGFCGGGIAGLMENSTMYNCEISGTEVVNNSTSGVTGVGGEGLYMGGLVGWMEDSVIEYSRARSNYVNEGGSEVIKQSIVRNDYDIAVGALGGKSVYAGGIVGGVNTTDSGETKIIDCFSTADVSFYAANYVAVGSGISGYAGGITGALRGNSHIERCHYAGNIHSKQYNAVLVIPIIQTDVNISGISNINKSGTSVANSYFKRSSSASTKDIYAVGTKADTEEYAAKTDDVYADYEFWKSKDYDLTGTIPRDTKNGSNHINKWVMDHDLGIPVHGDTVYGTFNFPDSAEVTIDKTALVNSAVATEDSYQFAAQGLHPRGDHEITLHVEPKDSNPDDGITEYRFDGWHRKNDVKKNYASDIKELDCSSGKPESTEKDYTVQSNDSAELKNSLFIADMKARVAFYAVDGTEIKADYYTYQKPLENVVPTSGSDKSMFYGWTTVANPDTGGGYPAITSNQLEKLKLQNAIYKAGDPVEKAMKLYPIYKNELANIRTEFEGHELDNSEQHSMRAGVGETAIDYDKNGAYIDVSGVEIGGAFPDGYRFLGWYKQEQTDNGTSEICVSREKKYYVPNASEPVTYVARFEYRVEYYVSLKQNDNQGYGYRNFYTEWVKYKELFDEAYATSILPKDYDHDFNHWSDVSVDGSCGDTSDKLSDKTEITEPKKIYAHWTGTGRDNISIMSDFPNAVSLSIDRSEVGNMQFIAKPFQGYRFYFWAEESRKEGLLYGDKWQSDIGAEQWETNHAHHTFCEYLAEAHLAAEINFHKRDDTTKQVLRRYEQPVFMETDTVAKYQYPISGDAVGTEYNLTQEAAPTKEEMQHPDTDYEFLGWIQGKSEGSKNGIKVNGNVWNKIYNVAGDKYCTSNVAEAIPYLIDKNAVVTETMDLYPVYAKYQIETTTNIHEIGELPQSVSYPSKPDYSLKNIGTGVSEVTVTAKSGVDPIITDEDTKYTLVGMKCIMPDGTETDLWNQKTEGQDGYSFKMQVDAGKNYKFVAIYTPAVLVYHMTDKDTSYQVKNINSQVGTMPVTTNAEHPTAYMAAWVKDKPSDGSWCHHVASKAAFDNANYQIVTAKTIVKQSMELYPVFIESSVEVQSNIDKTLKDQGIDLNTVRYIQNTDNKFSIVANDCKGYVFKGWYTEYQSEQNLGTLVSEKPTYNLTKKDLLDNTTKVYTAVYAEAIDINYHDYDGNILYTAKTTDDENRSFVEKNDSGQEIPIDVDAFTKVIEKTHQLGEDRGTDMQFVEWRLQEQESDGTYVYQNWKDFKDKKITESVDLYPVAYEVGFYSPADSSAGSADVPYEGMEYSVRQEEDGTKRLDALFTTEYTDSQIKITTKEITWEKSAQIPNGGRVEKGISGIHTEVYMKGVPDGSQNDTYINAGDGNVDTDKDGVAIHHIYGTLIIKKVYPKGACANETVIMNLQKQKADGSAYGKALDVPITVGADGTGEVQLKMPLGKYEISEDLNWSWRDTLVQIEKNGTLVTGMNKVSVESNVLAPEMVTFTNSRTNNKWFSDSCEKRNEFGKITTAGGDAK